MALKLTINDPVEVIGPLRSEYKKGADGKFHLVLEGDHPDTVKLSEFRSRNIALMKEVDELRPLKVKYEGIDPDAAKAALAKLAAFDGVDPEEYRTLKARPDATKLAAELDAEKAAHAATQFRNTVSVEFLRSGGRESAVDFMVAEAAKVFAADGTTKEFSASNPAEPLTIAEWMGQQTKVTDFAFLPSRGGGARPNQSLHFGARSNSKILKNPTPQELGANATAIAKGDITIEYTE